jgi:GT2 family glycosyltransferase
MVELQFDLNIPVADYIRRDVSRKHSGREDNQLKIGIVTPATDESKYLEDAIASIRHESDVEIEHIIVYDGSDDFATSIRERYPNIRLVGGEGRGACAAAILGFEKIDGDFLIQLNSDDRLGPGCIDMLVEKAASRPDVQIWTGGTVLFETDSADDERLARCVERQEEIAFNLPNLLDDLPSFTARFCHRSMYEAIGGLDMKFIHCNDRELMVRALIADMTEAPLGCIVSEMRIHPGSKTLSATESGVPEFMLNHLELADLWLGCKGLPAPLRRVFKIWRARELLRLVLYELRSLHLAAAFTRICRETFKCPTWIAMAPTIFAAVRRRRRTALS